MGWIGDAVAMILGAALIAFNRTWAEFQVEAQHRAWGFRMGPAAVEASRFISAFVGIGLVVFGALGFLGTGPLIDRRNWFLLVEPPVLVAAAAALAVLVGGARGRPRWPAGPVAWAWLLAPAVLNTWLWLFATPVFGWRVGGLSRSLSWGIDPVNGLVFGALSAVPLAALLGTRWTGWRLAAIGFLLQASMLLLWWAWGAQLPWVVAARSS